MENMKNNNGVKCAYSIKKCTDCNNEKIIHNFAERCLDCRKKFNNKHVSTYTFNKTHIIAVRPYDNIVCEGTTTSELIRNLKASYNITIPNVAVQKNRSIEVPYMKGVFYWFYKGLIIIWKEFYSDEVLEQIFISRVNDGASKWVRKQKTSEDIPKERLDKILFVVNNLNKLASQEIADRIGMSRAWVSHISTGRIYSNITQIEYKKAYNEYNADGEVVVSRERVSTKIYKIRAKQSNQS